MSAAQSAGAAKMKKVSTQSTDTSNLPGCASDLAQISLQKHSKARTEDSCSWKAHVNWAFRGVLKSG